MVSKNSNWSWYFLSYFRNTFNSEKILMYSTKNAKNSQVSDSGVDSCVHLSWNPLMATFFWFHTLREIISNHFIAFGFSRETICRGFSPSVKITSIQLRFVSKAQSCWSVLKMIDISAHHSNHSLKKQTFKALVFFIQSLTKHFFNQRFFVLFCFKSKVISEFH